MELYQLRTFATVARLGNVTQAAQVLHLTQSTVSGHIKALEGALAVPLFVRSATGVALTAFGHHALAEAHKMLALADALHADARRHAGHLGGQVRLAVVNDPETIHLGKIMSGIRERCPAVTVAMQQGLSGWALNEVKTAQRDAGFFIGELNDPEICAIPIRKIHYRIVAPIAWRAEIEADGWAAIGRLPWIWISPQGSYPRLVTELLARHGATPNKVVETDREAIMQNLVSAGVGLCLLREERIRQAQPEGRIFVWDEGRTSAMLSFIHLQARGTDPLIQALAEVVRALRPRP